MSKVRTDESFRTIRTFENYAINKKGEVISRLTGRRLVQHRSDYDYYRLTKNGKRHHVATRRLMKLANLVDYIV